MKNLLFLLLCNFIPLFCIVAAFILLYNDKKYWGWFLIVALCLYGSVKVKNKSKNK